MKICCSLLSTVAVALFLGSLASAAVSPETRLAESKKLADDLRFQGGEIHLRDGLATITVPEQFRYLGPEDSETVLTKIWHNPPTGERTLGMLFPAKAGPLDDGGWAVVITYDEDGYVKDDEAAKLNYDDLLKEMQAGTAEANKLREKKGYPPVELVGWAAQPRYDQAEHKMYWAKALRFGTGTEEETTLNYNIRMLGRRGVLVLNVIAVTSQLAAIEQAAPAILAMVNFQEGHRYTDFNPSTDKVATYGLAALVAGGVMAKAGFFKLLLAGLIAAKKVVIVGAIALIGVIKTLVGKLTGRRDSGREEA